MNVVHERTRYALLRLRALDGEGFYLELFFLSLSIQVGQEATMLLGMQGIVTNSTLHNLTLFPQIADPLEPFWTKPSENSFYFVLRMLVISATQRFWRL